MNSNRKDNVDMKGSRKGSADLSDLEIAAINRERNAEHVSFEKKMTVHLRILSLFLQLTQLLSYTTIIIIYITGS